MQRPQQLTNSEDLCGELVLEIVCPFATYYLAVLFNVPAFLLYTVDTCFTSVSLPSAFDKHFFFVALQPNLDPGRLIVEVSR
jgi:hypothetical protein